MFGEGEGVEVGTDPEPDFPLGVLGGDVGYIHLAVREPTAGEVLRHGGDHFPLDLVRLAFPLAGLAVGIHRAGALGHLLGGFCLFLGEVEGGGAVVVDFVVPPCPFCVLEVAIVLDHVGGQPILGGVADLFHGIISFQGYYSIGGEGLSTPHLVQYPLHFVMGAVGFEHDFPLDGGVLEGGVALHKIHVAGDEAVQDFGGHAGAGRCVLGHEAVVLAKLAVGGAVCEGFRHFHGIPNLEVTQNLTTEAVKPFEGGVQCIHIEAGIVGDNRNHIFTAGGLDDVHQNTAQAHDFPLALGDVLEVAGQFLGIVAGLHPLHLAEEDFPHDVGLLADDGLGGGFDDRIADVIGEIVAGHNLVELQNVTSFGIQNHQTIFHSKHTPFLIVPLSWGHHYNITHPAIRQPLFWDFFKKIFGSACGSKKVRDPPKTEIPFLRGREGTAQPFS